jgi:hypothetical protein
MAKNDEEMRPTEPTAELVGDDGRGRGRPQPAEPNSEAVAGAADVSEDTCPSITCPPSRHVDEFDRILSRSTFAIDWWESSGCLSLGDGAKALFDELERCQRQAELYREPVPCSLGDGQILVHEGGMGRGRATHFPFRLEWLGATIGLADRKETSRKVANFYLKIPGEPCVIHGAQQMRAVVLALLGEFDACLEDEWFRRLDLCLDLPGCDWETTFAYVCEGKQYMGSATRSSPHREGGDTTGFSVKTGNADLVLYDKLRETLTKKPEAYRHAMILNRWGGELPDHATRIEYQLRRQWFADLALTTVESVMGNLPNVVTRIARFEEHPFFVLTDCVPDREGHHQSRAGVLLEWRRAIERMRELAGKPFDKLRRIDRGMMDAKRCFQNVIGYLITALVQLGVYVESRRDLEEGFSTLLNRNEIDDETIQRKWADKARRAGTFEAVSKFPYGDNLAA